nr:capsid protein [Coypu astrovirus 1]
MVKAKQQKAPKVQVTVTPTNGGKRKQKNRKRRNQQKVIKQGATIILKDKQQRRRMKRNGPRNQRRGPTASVTQTVTAALGTVGANTSDSVETEMVILLNPALIKEATGSNQFGPIQIYASTYSLWRIKKAAITLTPLIGPSAVSGTVVRTSLNMTATPSAASWSALGARKHKDVTPGRKMRFTIQGRDLPGPKEGWFQTNTKGDPGMSIAGAIEINSFGKTTSAYTNTPFNGSLFMCEFQATWEFANYNPNPGMLNMVKGEVDSTKAENTVTITAQAGQPIFMDVAQASTFARTTATNRAQSEKIWQIVDTGVNSLSDVFPPPFNWLMKGGWWFVKRVVGAPVRTGMARYQVFQTIQDARSNTPCIANATKSVEIRTGNMHYIQVVPENLGLADTDDIESRTIELPDYDPSLPIESIMTWSLPRVNNTSDRNPNAPGIYDYSTTLQDDGNIPQHSILFPGDHRVQINSVYRINPAYWFQRQSGAIIQVTPDLSSNTGYPIQFRRNTSQAWTTVGYVNYYTSLLTQDYNLCFANLIGYVTGTYTVSVNTPNSLNLAVTPTYDSYSVTATRGAIEYDMQYNPGYYMFRMAGYARDDGSYNYLRPVPTPVGHTEVYFPYQRHLPNNITAQSFVFNSNPRLYAECGLGGGSVPIKWYPLPKTGTTWQTGHRPTTAAIEEGQNLEEVFRRMRDLEEAIQNFPREQQPEEVYATTSYATLEELKPLTEESEGETTDEDETEESDYTDDDTDDSDSVSSLLDLEDAKDVTQEDVPDGLSQKFFEEVKNFFKKLLKAGLAPEEAERVINDFYPQLSVTIINQISRESISTGETSSQACSSERCETGTVITKPRGHAE